MKRQQKILIVDDEHINITVLANLLKPRYRIMVARNGAQALKAAHTEQPPDLILLDIMMPGMDGYEVCRRLQGDPATREIPVIYISAMGEVDDETRGLELGAVDYIVKPISPPILMARVRTHLALKQSREELQRAYALIKSQKDRMQAELSIGRDIQMSMLPVDFPTAPEHPELSLYARLEPAREVGGDFYDFFFLDESRFCFCIGDVSDKGVPAALLMAVTKTLIKSHARGEFWTGNILTQVNDTLSRDNVSCMFVTLFVGICDIDTGKVIYTNAGHNPPYLVTADGELERMDQRHGPVAGAMDGIAYRESETRLQRGDTLLLYTDGVTEACNPAGDQFSEKRLADLLTQAPSQPATELVDAILSGVKSFENDAARADDITLLALRFMGGPGSGAGRRSMHKVWSALQRTDEVNVWFNRFASSWGIDTAVRRRINLVFDELLNNLIAHGYGGKEAGEIEIRLDLTAGELKITVIDDGLPFNPLLMATPDTRLALEEREIGGLGVHLVRSLVDQVDYQRLDEHNQVTLVIEL